MQNPTSRSSLIAVMCVSGHDKLISEPHWGVPFDAFIVCNPKSFIRSAPLVFIKSKDACNPSLKSLNIKPRQKRHSQYEVVCMRHTVCKVIFVQYFTQSAYNGKF